MTASVPCPECGEVLTVVIEPRTMQLVGGNLVIAIKLDDESAAHLDAHD